VPIELARHQSAQQRITTAMKRRAEELENGGA
jgi:hypothetical protein